MNPRTTGILFVVALALGAFVYFYEIRGGEQRSEAEARAKQVFPDVEAADVEWLELGSRDGAEVRAERVENGWRLRAPVDFPADVTQLDGIADGLASLTSESVYEDPEPPEVYGLDEGAQELRFSAAGDEHRLRIGSKTPVGANHYVATGAGDTVYTVPSFSVNRFERSLDDLREARPLRFDREAIGRIEAQWEGGGVELEREDDRWRLVAPLESAVDREALEGFLSELAFLRAEGFVDDPTPEQLALLDPPAYRVVLGGPTPEGGGEPPRHELVIGGLLDESGARLARSAEPSLYRIAEDRFEALPRRVVHFRFKALSDFEAADAVRFEIDYVEPDAEGATRLETLVGEREDGGWTTEPLPMRAGAASRLVDALSRLVADDIAAESMGPDERAGLGLSPPRATVRVYGAPAGDEAPSLLAEVELGRAQGEQIYARVPGRETVYALDYALAEDVPISFEAFQNRFVSRDGEAGGDAAGAGATPAAEPPPNPPGP